MAYNPNNPNGRAAASASEPVVLSNEDKTVLDNIKLGTDGTTQQLTAANLLLGATNEAAAASDTATSGHNGLLKRLLQRITTLITNLGSPMQTGGSIGNTAFGVNNAGGASAVNIQDGGNSITIDGAVTANAGSNLNTSLLALESTQNAQSTLIGAVTETAPASDTASSGLNGRLQRIAQRISALIALLPTSIGNKATAASLGVALSTEQASNLLDIRNDIFSMSSSLAKNSDLIDLKNITDVKLGDITLATTNIEGYQSGFDTKLANIDSNTANIYLRQADGNQITQISTNRLTDFRNSSLSLNVTSINSLASSLTACAVTERVTNIRNAIDLLIHVIIDHANTAPSTSGTDFVWLIPWYHDGTTWTHPDLGNTTVLTGSNQTVTLGAKHNLTLLGVMNYTLADQVTRRVFSVSKVFGQTMPDGFQILMQNDSGAAYAASGNSLIYKEIYQKLIV